MKKVSTYLLVLLAVISFTINAPSFAQMVGDQVFLQGKWVEVGVAPNGSLGSTRLPPTGFHCNSPTFTFWDPAAASSTTSNQRLMMVYDAGHNGWTVGTPGFFGDYSMPGTPYEGWGVQVNGSHSQAQMQYFQSSTAVTGFAGAAGLTGTNIGYTNPLGQMRGVWQGTASGGNLQITQTTILDTTASWVRMNVKFKNIGSTTLTGVYYARGTDPDNDQLASGLFTTVNVINHQNDYYHRVMVTATATMYTTQTLSLSTKDCRARCYIGVTWPMSTALNLATLWSSGSGGYLFSGTSTGDQAIGLVYNLGNIAVGDSTEINYAYVFNGLLGIDSAISHPTLVVDGIPRDTADTVTSCSFTLASLSASIDHATTADWFGSTWTWSPGTYLATTTGTTNTISVASITAPITYTITGTTGVTGCSGRVFFLTVMPPGATPPPTTTDTIAYCLGETTVPLSASGIGTIHWWSTPTGGTSSLTPPTPSSASVGVTTYYVSQDVAGCPSVRIPVTIIVFALSTPITGSLYACTGTTTTLSNATTGGIWTSTNPTVATIGSSSGIVTGGTAGTSVISYAVLGCIATTTVTVVTTPAAITGIMIACLGSTTSLSCATPGGSWSTACPTIATVGSSTGIVTGVSLGTCIVTYDMGGGCFVTATITVNPYPAAITGAGSVCVGATTPLSSATPSGLWTSSLPSVAGVGVVSGLVTGVTAGTATISYRVNGCSVTKVMTVVTAATPIVGPSTVCQGSTIVLTNSSTGGTWTSACPTVLTIGSSSGIVTGVGTGTCTITYSLSAGCTTTKVVTVVGTPPSMTGSLSICIGQTTTLSHGTAGGTWSSACPTIITTGLGTGIVTGLNAGTCHVTYTLPSGCITVSIVTVNAAPGAITGSMSICQGQTTTLSSATPGGAWTSGAPTIASVGAGTGVVTGLAPGTAIITYSAAVTGCGTTAVVTVNAIPAAITGTATVCLGETTLLSDATPGGGWSSSDLTVATISGGGLVTGVGAGTAMISYTLPTGCFVTRTITVNAGPAAITGSLNICLGNTTTLASATPGGVWTSSAPLIASVLSPGLIGGAGIGTATISYTFSGCSATAVVSVNPVPGPIGGTLTVCVGQTTTLTNSITGGSWSSSASAIGTIDPVTGVLTGLTAGTTTIVYSSGAGCNVTAVATVNGLAAPVSGTLSLCQGATTTLTSAPAGGTWFSDVSGVATIGVSSGFVNAVAPGTSTITYTPTTGCRATAIMTVNGLPSVISGTTAVCAGQCTTLTNTVPGGTWSVSNALIGTINAAGLYCGVSAGTNYVTYTLPTGCYRTLLMQVNPLPSAISGSLQVCVGATSNLTGTPSGGTWQSVSPAIGSITTGGGVLAGNIAGTTTIIYTLGAPTSCALSVTATVNPLPSAITGTLSVCIGQTTTLSSATPGGTWSNSCPAIATVSSGGVVTGVGSGTCNITYTSSAGCRIWSTVTVYSLPGMITGAANLCPGTCATLNCLPAGGTWTISSGTATIGVTTGAVCGVSPGTATVTYTLGTGCISTRVVTINAAPDPITGTLATCVGQCTPLADLTPGGVWSSGTAAIGTINSSTGVLCGVSAGTTLVSYTVSATTCRATAIVTVYALPGTISGTLNACEGQCTPFTNSSPGGSWSSSNVAVGTIDASSGMFCGILMGTTTITYALGTGCITTAVVSVNPVPAPITGPLQVCIGATTTLSSFTTGGSWYSGSTSTATVGLTTGIVMGAGAGTSLISYRLSTGCQSTATVTVHPLPSVIAGPSEVCVNSSIILSSSPSSGTWGSPHSTVAVNPVTGEVNGLSAGTATISYTVGIGCVRTTTITVNPQPNAITGSLGVCLGQTSLLFTTSTGGTWNSSHPAIAPIDATGLVTGLAFGTSNITYTLPVTGCTRVVQVTVNPLPGPITGSDGFCNLTSTTYTTFPAGGTWSSADTNILTIDPMSGVATGKLDDTTDVIFTNTFGCTATKRVFLILAPYPISGVHDICVGQTVTLGNPIGGGVWSSDDMTNVPVDPVLGTVTGAGIGDAMITYQLSTGCASTHYMTVNPIPGGIDGSLQVCEGLTTTLSNLTMGGTWISSNPLIATIGSATGLVTGIDGGISGNTVTITYALGTGCNATKVFTVNPLPGVITGTPQVCEGSTTNMGTSSTGGIWISAEPFIADIDAATGVMTGMSAMTPGIGGLGVTVITYQLPTTCIRTQSVTVNPLPTPISGSMNVCVDDCTLLSNSTPGGGWISSNPVVGTIDGVTGIFCGLTAGTSIVSYVLPTGCVATWPMQVFANPLPISGSLSVCAGFATNLTSGPSGGTWSQDPPSMIYGTIHSMTGVVSGIMAGVIPVTYTMGSGCRAFNEVTVITLPAVISGPPRVCVNDSVDLTNPVFGGVWSSSNPARATVNPGTGKVHGISAGPVTITYTVGTGCFNILNMTVNPLPLPITGPLQVCEGSQIVLSSGPTPGGIWISDATSVASVGFISGIVSGLDSGVANISYTIAATGCLRAVQVTVDPTPAAIAGNAHVCIGASASFTNTTPGGTWLSSNPAVATIGLTTGVVTSVSLGTAVITYQIPATGCRATLQITVQPLPNVYNVTGGGSYCSGGNGVSIGLDGSQPGVSYVLYHGASATGYLSGTGFPLDFDLHTAAGVYTIQATNVTSSCVRNMAGSATVTVIPLVTPSVTTILTPYDSVCPGQSVTLAPVPVNGGTAPTYLWKVNGVSVSTGMSYGFVPANGDVVTVIMTSNANCKSVATASADRTITVLPNAMPIADVVTTPNDTICQFSPVTFTAAPTYGGVSPTFMWMVNGVVVGSGSSYSYIPVDGDVVKMTMVSDYRCRLATTVTSGDVNMSVDSMLIPMVSVYPEPGFMVESGKPVTLHTIVTNGGTAPKYQWKRNGLAIPGATLSSYTGIFNDYDSVTCVVTSSGVCNNIGTHDWVFITVAPLGTQSPATIASDIRLIPNPNKGVFTIKGNLGNITDGDVNVDVTDMLGQVVYRGIVTTKQGRLDAQVQLDNTLANGMYILTLRTGQEQKVFHFVMEQ